MTPQIHTLRPSLQHLGRGCSWTCPLRQNKAEALVQCHECPYGERRSGRGHTEGRPCEDVGRRWLCRPGERPRGPACQHWDLGCRRGTQGGECAVHAPCTPPGEQTRPARERGRPDAQRQTAWAPARGRQSPHRARTARCAHEDTFLDFECHECAFSLKHQGLEQQAPGLNSFCDCRRTVR